MPRQILALVSAVCSVAMLAPTSAGGPEVASVLGSGMVLQRDGARLWGTTESGSGVLVIVREPDGTDPDGDGTAGGVVHRIEASADAGGRWVADLPPTPAGGPYTVVLADRGGVTRLEDVLFGEVWIASGQSNMRWPMERLSGYEADIASASWPRLRLLTVLERSDDAARDEADPVEGWRACEPSTVAGFSGVAYHFGRELQEHLRDDAGRPVPVGLVLSAWGGTRVESWIPPAVLAGLPTGAATMERWPSATGNAAHPRHRPGGLYNAMIHPLTPMRAAGVIWYQGEGNAGASGVYADLFAGMINAWRERFADPALPFLFVQLANFKARAPEPVESGWAGLRDAQSRVRSTVPGTGMAVAIDIGEADDIHPRNKREVGRRLSLLARRDVYGQAVTARGPSMRSVGVSGAWAEVVFDHARGLTTSGSDAAGGEAAVEGFALRGADGVWRWASAQLVPAADASASLRVVRVRSPDVPVITGVRHAWADNPARNLVNGEGLPAEPFAWVE